MAFEFCDIFIFSFSFSSSFSDFFNSFNFISFILLFISFISFSKLSEFELFSSTSLFFVIFDILLISLLIALLIFWLLSSLLFTLFISLFSSFISSSPNFNSWTFWFFLSSSKLEKESWFFNLITLESFSLGSSELSLDESNFSSFFFFIIFSPELKYIKNNLFILQLTTYITLNIISFNWSETDSLIFPTELLMISFNNISIPLSIIKVLCNLISLSNIIFKLLRTSNLLAVVIHCDNFLSSCEFFLSSWIILSSSIFESLFDLRIFSSSKRYNLYIFKILLIILLRKILSIHPWSWQKPCIQRIIYGNISVSLSHNLSVMTSKNPFRRNTSKLSAFLPKFEITVKQSFKRDIFSIIFLFISDK